MHSESYAVYRKLFRLALGHACALAVCLCLMLCSRVQIIHLLLDENFWFGLAFTATQIFIACQIMLFIVWGTLGTDAWDRRFAAFTLGVVCLEWLGLITMSGWVGSAFQMEEWWVVRRLAYIVVTSGLLFAARAWWFELRWFERERLPPATPFQFSIWQIMLTTTVVAVVCAVAQLLRQAELPGLMEMTITPALDIGLTLGCIWAVLASHRCELPVALMLCFAPLSGFLTYNIYTSAHADAVAQADMLWGALFSGALLELLGACILIGSLWVVRKCGFRLIAKTLERGTTPLIKYESPFAADDIQFPEAAP